jgi:hypothetical protein
MGQLDGLRISRKAGGGRCPYCRDSLSEDGTRDCADCGTAYHGACWGELGGCATLGCRGIQLAPGGACRKCRQPLEATQLVLACSVCQELTHADCCIAGSACGVPKCGGQVEFLKAEGDWSESISRSTLVLRAPQRPVPPVLLAAWVGLSLALGTLALLAFELYHLSTATRWLAGSISLALWYRVHLAFLRNRQALVSRWFPSQHD